MSGKLNKSITLYTRQQPILIYENQEGISIVKLLDDHNKDTIKKCISQILNIPKQFITINKQCTNAISDEYCRQIDFKLGYIE